MPNSEYQKSKPMVNVTTRVQEDKLIKAKEMNLNVSKIFRDALDKEISGKSKRKSAH